MLSFKTMGEPLHVSSIHLDGFKRFSDTTIERIPLTARLVVLAGPNGSGKSSLFDALNTWHRYRGRNQYIWEETYGAKVGAPSLEWTNRVKVEFHEPFPAEDLGKKKMVYVRTAFRNEADFQITSFNRLPSPLEGPGITRLIDNDVSVSENYQRLLMQTIDGIYDETLPDKTTKAEIRNRVIGEVQLAMRKVFPDLQLTGVGSVTGATGQQGTFYFQKGSADGFLYKNLSAGEKAAFDLILDAVVKREYYDDTIWCLDEPETHLNTRVQGALLEALLELLPPRCQLWIASHSLGFMRKAWDMARTDPDTVTFLDLDGHDFDAPTRITPIQPSREFWAKTLDVALGDLASLVAPERIVLCEGRPKSSEEDSKAAFDAACYRQIFSGEFPNTDFISVGNSQDASKDRLELGFTIQALSSGTRIDRLIDRDLRDADEVAELIRQNIRVLGRRNIESYLLDDEVLRALCISVGQPEKVEPALLIKSEQLAASVARGNDPDDLKSPAGSIYVGLRKLLGLTQSGSNWSAFAKGSLSPLIKPGMATYDDLRGTIFG